jgi:hypothetical protein
VCRPELLVMLVTSGGQLLRWSAPLLELQSSPTADEQPQLQPALQGERARWLAKHMHTEALSGLFSGSVGLLGS